MSVGSVARRTVRDLRLIGGYQDWGVVMFVLVGNESATCWYNTRLVRPQHLWLVQLWAQHAIWCGLRFDAVHLDDVEAWPPA